MASLLMGVIITDVDGSCVYANAKALEVLDRSWKELRGINLHDIVCCAPGKNGTHIADECVFTRPLRTGKIRLRRIQTMYSKSGDPCWIEYSNSAIKEKKQIVACLLSFVDASKIQRTKNEFAEAQALFKAVFDAYTDSVFIIDSRGVIIQSNSLAAQLFDRIEFGFTEFITVLDPVDIGEIELQMKKIFSHRKPKVFTVQSKRNGHFHYYEVRFVTHIFQDKHVATVREITNQLRDQLKKERMMAIAGHELRTPIAVIKSFTQLVKRQLKNTISLKYLNYLDRIDGKASVLLQLFNNVIDEVRAGENKLIFVDELVDIDTLVAETARDMQIVVKQHKLEITGSTGVQIKIDKGRMTQVLSNILTNAIKYSPEADRVTIHIATAKTKVFISVTDYGIGIHEQAQRHIFEAFYRGSKRANAEFPGLGLGLYLSNNIVQYYGGKILFDSVQGKGTTVTINLPIKKASISTHLLS